MVDYCFVWTRVSEAPRINNFRILHARDFWLLAVPKRSHLSGLRYKPRELTLIWLFDYKLLLYIKHRGKPISDSGTYPFSILSSWLALYFNSHARLIYHKNNFFFSSSIKRFSLETLHLNKILASAVNSFISLKLHNKFKKWSPIKTYYFIKALSIFSWKWSTKTGINILK